MTASGVTYSTDTVVTGPMESTDRDRYRERLLVERIAALFGFAKLADRIPRWNPYPPYLFYGFWILFDIGVLNVYRHLTGGRQAFLVDPFWIAIPLGLVLATIGVRYMRDGYADAIAQLRVHERIENSDPEPFQRTLPMRVKLGAYGIGLGLFFWNALFNIGLSTIFAIEGVVPGLVANFFLIPVVYLPLMVEFVLLYFSIHVLLPRRIAAADIGLFFFDPRNMGGFAPIGQLLKRTYYLFTGGLLLYFLMTYGSTIVSEFIQTPHPEPGFAEAAFFSLAWLGGLASLAYSMHTIHRVMISEKEERIRRLEAQLRSAIENPYDIESAEFTDPETIEDSRRRLEQVRATRDYPTTFSMWSQILVSVLLPQALNMAVQIGL